MPTAGTALDPPPEATLESQLYRYAEDLYQLMTEYDALQQRYRSLELNYRSITGYRDLLSTLMRSAGESYLATDLDLQIIQATHGAAQLFRVEALAGRPLPDFLSPASRLDLERWLTSCLSDPDAADHLEPPLIALATRPHLALHVRLLVGPTRTEDRRHLHWILRPAGQGLTAHSELSRLAFEKSSEAVFILDRSGRLCACNAAFTATTGYPAEAVLGELPSLLSSGSLPAEDEEAFWHALLHGHGWQGEHEIRHRDGHALPIWQVAHPVHDRQGELSGAICIFHDLSRLQHSEQQLSVLAYHDALTGLPNRQLFSDRLRMALSQARRQASRLAVFFLDLDRFKQVNDTLGHETGDELLKEVARRLGSVTREADTVARLGGDEFTVILPGLQDLSDAHTVAEKILGVFQAPVHIGEHDLFAAPSIGIAVYPDHGQEESLLLRRADSAMYRAKSDGGNTYRVFEADDEIIPEILSIETAFHRALERGELHLVYQPQVSADASRLLGVEALLRWNSPEFGEVSPEIFIPIAERTGIILEVGRWVLETACEQLSRWRLEGLDRLRVSVNVSPRQLRDAQFSNDVLRALTRSGLPGEALELEITESELMLYPEATLLKLEALRHHGISIAIDDFGTGYSSLARLRKLPVDRIKVDRAFVRDIETDNDAQAISSCIVTMARVLHLEVIAEGVETTHQLHHLLGQGCHTIQGYLFARPMPPEALPGWKENARLD